MATGISKGLMQGGSLLLEFLAEYGINFGQKRYQRIFKDLSCVPEDLYLFLLLLWLHMFIALAHPSQEGSHAIVVSNLSRHEALYLISARFNGVSIRKFAKNLE